jgi:hypothetical protein
MGQRRYHALKMTQAERHAAERQRIASVIAANKRKATDPEFLRNTARANRRSAADKNSRWSRSHRRYTRSKQFREHCRRSALIAWARRKREA